MALCILMSESQTTGRTTVGVTRETHTRLKSARPDGLSDDEFIALLLRRWEGRQ